MNFPDPKKLKKLADACRKAGLKSFKCADFEFVLADEAPVSTYKQKKTEQSPAPTGPFQSDTLSDDALLFWSTGNITETNESGNQ